MKGNKIGAGRERLSEIRPALQGGETAAANRGESSAAEKTEHRNTAASKKRKSTGVSTKDKMTQNHVRGLGRCLVGSARENLETSEKGERKKVTMIGDQGDKARGMRSTHVEGSAGKTPRKGDCVGPGSRKGFLNAKKKGGGMDAKVINIEERERKKKVPAKTGKRLVPGLGKRRTIMEQLSRKSCKGERILGCGTRRRELGSGDRKKRSRSEVGRSANGGVLTYANEGGKDSPLLGSLCTSEWGKRENASSKEALSKKQTKRGGKARTKERGEDTLWVSRPGNKGKKTGGLEA